MGTGTEILQGNSHYSLNQLCDSIQHHSSVMLNRLRYVIDMNGSKSLIDHFVISDNLLNYINSSDVRDDIYNHSDHVPITMYLHISIPIKKQHIVTHACSYLNLNGFV